MKLYKYRLDVFYSLEKYRENFFSVRCLLPFYIAMNYAVLDQKAEIIKIYSQHCKITEYLVKKSLNMQLPFIIKV